MPARPSHTAFGASHALVPAICFGGTTALSMCAVQPVYVGISLAGALLFSLLARGARRTLLGLRWQLPLLALVCLANPLFSASGSTLLAKWGSVSVYAESLAFGATMGALMVAVVVWFEGAAAVLTQDRLLSLVGARARSVPLVVSMAAQLVPQLLCRSQAVRASLGACTAAGARPGARDALVRTSGMLLGWALEDSLGRADAMRARGWESGCARTCYRPDRVRVRDVADASALLALIAVNALLAWVACAQWRFYPTMPTLVAWWGYLPFAALVLWPSASELAGRARERGRA